MGVGEVDTQILLQRNRNSVRTDAAACGLQGLTLDFDDMEINSIKTVPGDVGVDIDEKAFIKLTFYKKGKKNCHVTYTNEKTDVSLARASSRKSARAGGKPTEDIASKSDEAGKDSGLSDDNFDKEDDTTPGVLETCSVSIIVKNNKIQS